VKIYCLTCREHVLNTSPAFKAGGPYSGDMFEAVTDCRWFSTAFNFDSWVTEGNLWCPRCTGAFIIGGETLTEHGIIKVGQKSVKTDVSVVHKDGPFQGQLKSAAEYSLEDPDYVQPSEPEPILEPEETRTEKVLRLRKAGLSYAKIGKRVNLSATYVSKIYKKAIK